MWCLKWTQLTFFALVIVTRQVLNGMSLSGLESFVKEQETLLCEQNGKERAKQSCERPGKDKRTSGKPHGTGWDLHNSHVFVSFILRSIPCRPREATCSNIASPLGCSKSPLRRSPSTHFPPSMCSACINVF